ncbi:MAG: CgeB family protein [Candidatus Deferrimicrobiaceae bacterium]
MEVFASRTGNLPVPRYSGKTIHSLYDPEGEAGRFVDAYRQRTGIDRGDKLVVLGNGFGYVAEALLGRGIHPVVFEPCAPLLAGMARHRDLPGFLARVPLYSIDAPRDIYRSGSHRESIKGAKGVLVLPYVNSLFPGWAASFEASLGAVERARNAFCKISVISPLVGGSLEIARHCARAFEGTGFLVDFVDVSGFGGVLPALNVFHADGGGLPLSRSLEEYFLWSSNRVMERIDRFDPAIVLVLAQAPVIPEHLRKMREEGRRVVFWFVEDSHLFRYWESDAANYDLFLPIQKGSFLRDLAAAGQPNHHYLPMAADATMFRPLELTPGERERFGSPLSFMGAGYYNRRKFFNALLGRPFKIWGTEWPEGEPLSRHVQEEGRRIDSADTARIFNATDVNVNLHSSVSQEGVNPFGDFVNPRTFEIAACSAFQLVDHRSLLPELFVPGEEVACFSGKEEFLEMTDYYLAHPAERAVYAGKAMRRVLKEHTYRDRMRELIEIVHEVCPPEEGRRLQTAGEMADAGGSEWKSLLRGFPPDRPLEFDTFLSGIRRKDPSRPFTEKETLALMLGGLRHGAT